MNNIEKFKSYNLAGTTLDYIDCYVITEREFVGINLHGNLNDENCEQIAELNAQIKDLYKKQKYNFQKIGMIKYDAFKEMGGNLSFALTLLDENNNGFIINSVHNIQSYYCYAKEVKDGKCNINLSEEEQIALDKALKYQILCVRIKKTLDIVVDKKQFIN